MNDSTGVLWPAGERLRPERALRRGITISVAVHLIVAVLAVAWPLWNRGPRLDLSDAFVVNLVTEPGPAPSTAPKGVPGASLPVALSKEAPHQPKALKAAPEPPEPKAAPVLEDKAALPEAPAREPRCPMLRSDKRLAEAIEQMRARIQREAELRATLAQLRSKTAAARGASGGDVGGGGKPGQTSLSFNLYYQAVWEKIRSHWALPTLRQQNLKAVVAVRISRDGSVEKVELESGSGDDGFDRSALNAVRAANPLPPLPGDYLGSYHEVGIRFHQ